MAAGELASVQRDRDDLPLADADLDPAADEVGVERESLVSNRRWESGGTRTTQRRSRSG
jgi:hypothetical protein